RRPIRRQSRAQDLQHEGGRLTCVQAIAHHEPAMVVHEGDEIDAPVLPLEDEGEEVRLPELIGPGALEIANLVRMPPRWNLLQLVAGCVKTRGDRLRARG